MPRPDGAPTFQEFCAEITKYDSSLTPGEITKTADAWMVDESDVKRDAYNHYFPAPINCYDDNGPHSMGGIE